MSCTEPIAALTKFPWQTEENDEYPQDYLSQDHDTGSEP